MKIIEIGKEGPYVCVIACLHGNEKIGYNVINALIRKPIKGIRIKAIIANEQAMKKNVRFIDSDLNRSFPGSGKGNIEEKLAAKIIVKIIDCEFIIDLHSTYANTDDMIIITKKNAMELAKKVPLKNVVFMSKIMAHGKSLIDYSECGIPVSKRVLEALLNMLRRQMEQP